MRHWHENEDEFVYILEGECVLIEDDGETMLKAGDCAGFKANVAERPLPREQVERATCCFSKSARARRASARTIRTST